MKTTKDERAMWGSVGRFARIPTQDVYHLIDDVDDAVEWLRQQHEALAPNKKLPHSLCGVCAFLKEPKS